MSKYDALNQMFNEDNDKLSAKEWRKKYPLIYPNKYNGYFGKLIILQDKQKFHIVHCISITKKRRITVKFNDGKKGYYNDWDYLLFDLSILQAELENRINQAKLLLEEIKEDKIDF